MPANDAVYIGLSKAINLLYNKMMDKLNSGRYPQGSTEKNTTSIQDATSIGKVDQLGTALYIDIIIDLKLAPFAAAFEWGSGIHATRGDKEKYRIPKEGSATKLLVFPESRWPNFIPGLTSVKPYRGYFYLPEVMHPGIEAKPYIEPTIRENLAEVKSIIGKEFKAQILRGVPKVTIISA